MAWIDKHIELIRDDDRGNLRKQGAARLKPCRSPAERHQPGWQRVPTHVPPRVELRSCLPFCGRDVDLHQIPIQRQGLGPG